ncbi:MAG: HAD family phosphatase [Treponema sp.]|jgi:HAD superfamily hydrolase (TIGR01509 family)|nr:HAD family phosphatase [Treponema sp.]
MLDKKYRAAIFDLDGTLANSMRVWDHICRNWLAGKGIAAGDGLERDIVQMTLTQSAEYVIRNYGIALDPPEIQAQWEAMVLRQYAETLPLKEGAEELVRAFAEAGMKLAIATSCFPAACEAFLARHHLRECFSAVMYTDEASRDKRFPDLYLACAARLHTAPRDCVVFEDFPPALLGVRAAGMGIVAVYDDRAVGQWEEFGKAADYAIRSFLEL